MINIFVVVMLFVMSAVFYILEYADTNKAYEYRCAGINIAADHYRKNAVRVMWLARLFLLSAVILSVIEQVTFIPFE